jgi:ubiquinone/menaquinone biosynthesis C-methylase UbiE
MGLLGLLRMQSREIEVQDRVSEYYEHVRYRNKYSTMYHHGLISIVISMIENDGRILDNGCGIGDLILQFPNKDIIGLDISNGMLEKAKTRMKYITRGDSESLPFRAESFDTIVCRSLLHHVKNKQRTISEMNRVLNHKGELIILEPIQSLLSLMPRNVIKESEHFSSQHGDFKEKELFDLLKKNFKMDRIINVGYIAYPLVGFPDIMNLNKYIPFKSCTIPLLMKFDEVLSKLPIINKQSWGIIARFTKNH